MSIKPVDFQVMLPKTPEISKIHSDEQQRNLALQQQQAASTQHKVDDNLRQVHSQERVQEARIREKQEKNQGGKKKEEEEKNREKEQEKDKTLYNKDKKMDSNKKISTIDIRL